MTALSPTMHDTAEENPLLTTQAPKLSLAEAQELGRQIYGVESTATLLSSERDQNFQLQSGNGQVFVLKVSNPAEAAQVTDFQTQAQIHLTRVDIQLPVPHLLPTLDGGSIHWLERPGEARRALRLITFLPGVPLYKVAARSTALRHHLGHTLARFDLALQGFSHPAAQHELLWDIQHLHRRRDLLTHIDSVPQRALAEHWMDNFEQRVLPHLSGLRRQVIHNDLNPYNVLVSGESGSAADRVSAILDFGDMVEAPLVNDLAVACSYQLSAHPDPLATAAECVAAYHAVNPLTEKEIDLLFDLIAARLLITVAITGWRAARYPENRAYILRNNPLSWAGLENFARLPREQAQHTLRQACGL